jgi:hypothetical protein
MPELQWGMEGASLGGSIPTYPRAQRLRCGTCAWVQGYRMSIGYRGVPITPVRPACWRVYRMASAGSKAIGNRAHSKIPESVRRS